MKYFQRKWDESRGDDHDDWGTSTWYFEVAGDGYPNRQIEVYANGCVLKYDHAHLEDAYGGLGDQALDLDDFKEFETTAEVFQAAWSRFSRRIDAG